MSAAAVCEVCAAPAPQRCGTCHLAAYCGREHQKQHWPKHKDACRCYEVRNDADLGRHLVASRSVEAGAVLLTDAPLVVGPRLHSAPGEAALCLGCLMPLDQGLPSRCGSCQWPLCPPCASHDSPWHRTHTPECALLKRAGTRGGWNLHIVTPLRCLLLQKKHPRRWQQLLELQAHEKERGPGTDSYRESTEIYNFLQEYILSGLEPNVLPERSEELVRRICGILDVNSLDVLLPTGTEVSALYPNVSLMEHSCAPNSRHSFELGLDTERRFRVTVRAAKHIARGEHISTMYTHALWGTQARREHLKATKYFDCRCVRCKDPTELGTYLSAIRCLGTQTDSDSPPCGGIQLAVSPLDPETDWHCNRCPVTVPSYHVAELVTRIGDQVDKAQQENPTVEHLESFLGKIETFLHPHHYHCYSVKHSLLQLYGQQQGYQLEKLTDSQLARKESLCRELLSMTTALDPGSARLALYSGVLHFELSRSLLEKARRLSSSALEPLLEARALLTQALMILEPEHRESAGGRMAELVRLSLPEVEKRLAAL